MWYSSIRSHARRKSHDLYPSNHLYGLPDLQKPCELLCCPAADFDITTKLEKIFSHNDIASVTVVKMEKSCCADMLEYVFDAAKMSSLPIPIQVTNLFVEAEDVTE